VLGAIAGDIIGSVYEWHNIKRMDFPLFDERCTFTDDTGLTVAHLHEASKNQLSLSLLSGSEDESL
jgi:ADP-ribosylglycohydrolase